ncbi:MAG: oligosaccharide flippase family protein [Planctomycetota bacterium]
MTPHGGEPGAASPPPIESEAPGQPGQAGGSLRRRAINSFLWTLLSFGGTRGISFVSNLILTALLYREAFGVMLIVSTVITGIHLFSDIGIGPSIIQSKRGDDPDFLDTAWTVQLIRGVGVFLVACVLAWPISVLYANPDLALMVPAAGFIAVLGGFTSTGFSTVIRNQQLKRRTILELAAQVMTLPVTAVLAWQLHSPWALLIGWSFADTLRMVLSHLMLPGQRNRFRLQRESVAEIVHFGRWILLSTVLTFFADRSDVLILGRLFTDADRGVYWIAQTIALVVPDTLQAVIYKVVFPTLSEIRRSDTARVGRVLDKFRRAAVPLGLIGLGILALFGQYIIDFLYKPEYADAGWMLRVLAAGNMMRLINNSSNSVWLALGDSFRQMTMNALAIPIVLIAVFVGNHFGGTTGTVIGIASADVFLYPYIAWSLRRKGLWNPTLDFTAMLIAGTGVALGAWLL